MTDLPAALVVPTARVADSFRAAVAEYCAAGELRPDDDSELATSLRQAGDLTGEAGFARYLQVLRDRERRHGPGRVPSTTLWFVRDDEFLGRLTIRHHLTDALRRRGGHIGYDVRPSARRRGHATAMLRAALPIAARLGITSALLTCDPPNVASRRVIEANGGVLSEGDGPDLHFWVPTGSTSTWVRAGRRFSRAVRDARFRS